MLVGLLRVLLAPVATMFGVWRVACRPCHMPCIMGLPTRTGWRPKPRHQDPLPPHTISRTMLHALPPAACPSVEEYAAPYVLTWLTFDVALRVCACVGSFLGLPCGSDIQQCCQRLAARQPYIKCKK